MEFTFCLHHYVVGTDECPHKRTSDVVTGSFVLRPRVTETYD